MDLKDRKILDCLDDDARAPLSKISRAVGLSKQVIDYRIRRMAKEGYIKEFTITCDLTRLGYSTFGVYLRLRNVNEKREQEIIDHLVAHPFTKWVVVVEGKWDLAFAVSARDILDFGRKKEEIIEAIGNNIESYETNIIISLQNFYADISGKKPIKKVKQERVEFASEQPQTHLDKTDLGILAELQVDSRQNIVALASTIRTTPDIVRYRIKKLREEGILTGYKLRMDNNMFGYSWYYLLIDLNRFPDTEKRRFLEKLKQIQGIAYIVRCMGKWDFEVHIHCEGNERFRKIVMQLRDELSKYIISYDALMVFKKHKSAAIPQGVIDELKRT